VFYKSTAKKKKNTQERDHLIWLHDRYNFLLRNPPPTSLALNKFATVIEGRKQEMT
jgi:hypothetical protein